jgi:hypothetical protein
MKINQLIHIKPASPIKKDDGGHDGRRDKGPDGSVPLSTATSGSSTMVHDARRELMTRVMYSVHAMEREDLDALTVYIHQVRHFKFQLLIDPPVVPLGWRTEYIQLKVMAFARRHADHWIEDLEKRTWHIDRLDSCLLMGRRCPHPKELLLADPITRWRPAKTLLGHPWTVAFVELKVAFCPFTKDTMRGMRAILDAETRGIIGYKGFSKMADHVMTYECWDDSIRRIPSIDELEAVRRVDDWTCAKSGDGARDGTKDGTKDGDDDGCRRHFNGATWELRQQSMEEFERDQTTLVYIDLS